MAASDGSLVLARTVPGYETPPAAPFSKALLIGDEIVISGLTARAADGTLRGGHNAGEQAVAILRELVAMVEAAGGHVGNIYKLVIYLTDMNARAELNRARAAVLVPPYPCSTMVGIKELVSPDLLVEIDAFANLRVDLRELARPV